MPLTSLDKPLIKLEHQPIKRKKFVKSKYFYGSIVLCILVGLAVVGVVILIYMSNPAKPPPYVEPTNCNQTNEQSLGKYLAFWNYKLCVQDFLELFGRLSSKHIFEGQEI